MQLFLLKLLHSHLKLFALLLLLSQAAAQLLMLSLLHLAA